MSRSIQLIPTELIPRLKAIVKDLLATILVIPEITFPPSLFRIFHWISAFSHRDSLVQLEGRGWRLTPDYNRMCQFKAESRGLESSTRGISEKTR